MNCELRKIGPEYAADVEKIEKECFSVPWGINTIISEMSNSLNTFIGAFSPQNLLVGYIGSQTVLDECSIFNVAVAKDERKCGIGDALVKYLVYECRNSNAETIFLEVRPSNIPAINLYEKNGFVFCGIRKNYYDNPRENAILMKFSLNGENEPEDPIEIWDE